MLQYDEPTMGQHFEDIRLLLNVLQKLVERSNSVLVIGRDPDVIKIADYIVDMGLKGCEAGGEILFAVSPQGDESSQYVYSQQTR